MVARLELSRVKTNGEYSTDMMSGAQYVALSAFGAPPPQHRTPDIEKVVPESSIWLYLGCVSLFFSFLSDILIYNIFSVFDFYADHSYVNFLSPIPLTVVSWTLPFLWEHNTLSVNDEPAMDVREQCSKERNKKEGMKPD